MAGDKAFPENIKLKRPMLCFLDFLQQKALVIYKFSRLYGVKPKTQVNSKIL